MSPNHSNASKDPFVTRCGPTYPQAWTEYNRAQCEEKTRFKTLLADLCRSVEQPAQHRGRPRLPLGEMVFAATYKVFSGFSSRRFTSDLRDAHADGLISRTPHFNSVSNYLADAAMTPVLRELIGISALPLRAVEREFAVDSSGFTTSGFLRWYSKKHQRVIDNSEWVKAHIMIGVETHIVTSVEISNWKANDYPFLAPLLAPHRARFHDPRSQRRQGLHRA